VLAPIVEFRGEADFLLGHNLLGHDLFRLQAQAPELGPPLRVPVVDTLYLSPVVADRFPGCSIGANLRYARRAAIGSANHAEFRRSRSSRSPAARAVSAWSRVRCRWSVFDEQAEVVDEAGVAQQMGMGLQSHRVASAAVVGVPKHRLPRSRQSPAARGGSTTASLVLNPRRHK
jgi:hypothetical protein